MTSAKRRGRPPGGPATYICGGDDRPGPRGTDCPDPLHDHPLPSGYVDASEMAAHRLYKQWKNVKCKACGLYGWVPPMGTTQRDDNRPQTTGVE